MTSASASLGYTNGGRKVRKILYQKRGLMQVAHAAYKLRTRALRRTGDLEQLRAYPLAPPATNDIHEIRFNAGALTGGPPHMNRSNFPDIGYSSFMLTNFQRPG